MIASATLRERALGLAEAFPVERTEVRMLIDGLASMHDALGDHSAALAYYRRLAEITGKAFGPASGEATSAAYGVASQYRALGRYEEAQRLLRRLIQISRDELGEGHPQVDIASLPLAGVLSDMGRFAEARALYARLMFERALALAEATKGRGHPDYAAALSNLALLHKETGQGNAIRKPERTRQ